MEISEAVKEALSQGKGIVRQIELSDFGTDASWFLPSNSNLGCLLICGSDVISKLWNPTAEELMATDWIVYSNAQK